MLKVLGGLPVGENEPVADRTLDTEVENPERLVEFRTALSKVDWTDGHSANVSLVRDALADLVHREVEYYYQARKSQKGLSDRSRRLAVFFGTLGTLAPLVAGANPTDLAWVGPYGYPLLAVAAACLSANRLFGATGGHIRFATAQLKLEGIITLFEVEWSQWQATVDAKAPDATEQGFLILRRFATTIYDVIEKETVVWGDSSAKALREFMAAIDGKRDLGVKPVQDEQT